MTFGFDKRVEVFRTKGYRNVTVIWRPGGISRKSVGETKHRRWSVGHFRVLRGSWDDGGFIMDIGYLPWKVKS